MYLEIAEKYVFIGVRWSNNNYNSCADAGMLGVWSITGNATQTRLDWLLSRVLLYFFKYIVLVCWIKSFIYLSMLEF